MDGTPTRQKVRKVTPEELPMVENPSVLPLGEPHADDDVKSVKSDLSVATTIDSKARSTTSSARLRRLQKEKEAVIRLAEIEKQLLQKERETIEKTLNI